MEFQWTRFWAQQGETAQETDLLLDPESWLGNKNILPFDQIRHVPCLVLLGNPGLGKSIAVRQIVDQLRDQGETCVLRDFREFGDYDTFERDIVSDPDFEAWLTGDGWLHLFMDSLDEGRLVMQRLEYDIQRFLRNIPRERLLFRITCRSAELPSSFVDLLRELWLGAPSDPKEEYVQVYHLQSLREKDVVLAAEESGFDPLAFMQSVIASNVAVFAAQPITLNMLLDIYRERQALPTSRRQIYELGIQKLASEVSQSRQEDGFTGRDIEERLAAARHIAAATIIGNTLRVVTGANHFLPDNVRHITDCYPQDVIWRDPHDLMTEVLETGLFYPLPNHQHMWAHLSYGEYLAADYVAHSELTVEQIESLFINQADPGKKIAPKLRETVGWLATMRTDVFNWLMNADPEMLIHSSSVFLADEHKERLVEHYLDLVGSDKHQLEEVGWRSAPNLNHADLGNQLRTYLEDRTLPQRVRQEAMHLVIFNSVAGIDETLITLACDVSEDNQLRNLALRALADPKRNPEMLDPLRSLVEDPSNFHSDMDMMARLMHLLVPSLVSFSEFFGWLRLPGFYEFAIGSPYDELFAEDVLDRMTTKDLLAALLWVAGQGRTDGIETSVSGTRFVQSIMRRAWDHLENENVRAAFARAAWSRLDNFESIVTEEWTYIRPQPPSRYADELQRDMDKRRQLLQAMIDVLLPDQKADTQSLYMLRWSDIPLVLSEDWEWILQRTQSEPDPNTRLAYAHLLRTVADIQDQAQVTRIYDEYSSGQNRAISTAFSQLFEVIPIDSGIAEEGRQTLKTMREFEAKRRQLDREQLPLPDIIHQWLEKCQSDSANWQHTAHWLQANHFGHVWRDFADVREGEGWKSIAHDSAIVARVLVAALRYVEEQGQLIENGDPNAPIHENLSATAGYKALVLIANTNLLERVSAQCWQTWATTIVFNNLKFRIREHDVEPILVEHAHLYGSVTIADHLALVLNGSEEVYSDYLVEVFLQRLEKVPDPRWDAACSNYLKKTTPTQNVGRYTYVFEFLLSALSEYAHAAIEQVCAFIDNCDLSDENSRRVALRLIRVMAYRAREGSWWSHVSNRLANDRAFAEEVFSSIPDFHPTPFLHHLSDVELFDLYRLAINVVRFEDDIDFHGGTVPKGWDIQRWRDSIISELAGRGSSASIQLIDQLGTQYPQIPDYTSIRRRALEQFRYLSWEAPSPRDIFRMAADKKQLFIDTGDTLLELILTSLEDVQRRFRGDANRQRSVWDRQADGSWRPVEEAAFSDALASWLRDAMKAIVVNREIEVRQHTDRPLGDRTDIQIEAINKSGDALTVIIEVKGCWYHRFEDNVQTQLVDSYIANHNNCDHGVFVVGWFQVDNWYKKDRRKNACGSDKNVISNKLAAAIAKVHCDRPITVRHFVFDASLGTLTDS